MIRTERQGAVTTAMIDRRAANNAVDRETNEQLADAFRASDMNSALRAVVLGLGIALLIASCIVKRFTGPRLTGTCDGACAHYIECKPGHPEADRARCTAECPDVFTDRDSIMGYESLSCKDAVEYIDGDPKKTAGPRA